MYKIIGIFGRLFFFFYNFILNFNNWDRKKNVILIFRKLGVKIGKGKQRNLVVEIDWGIGGGCDPKQLIIFPIWLEIYHIF